MIDKNKYAIEQLFIAAEACRIRCEKLVKSRDELEAALIDEREKGISLLEAIEILKRANK